MKAEPKTAKKLMREILADQPEDSAFDDLLRKLAFHRMVARGLVDARQGRTFTTDQLRQRIKSWPS